MKPNNYPVEPKFLWQRFYEITQVPRPSTREGKIREYLVNVAKEKNVEYRVDSVGNVIMYMPASKGYENHETVILQSHMDMVCDKTPETVHDFDNDPIKLKVEDGWLKACGTTLGADDGIGCACMLAVLDDETIAHPPLELFFTVDEEQGLYGALHFDDQLLKGRKLLNLDTEEFGTAFVGSAGTIDLSLRKKLNKTNIPEGFVNATIEVTNLKGGHSGCDIIWNRGNAIKILANIFQRNNELEYYVTSMKSGKAHNIIPKDGYVNFAIRQSDLEEFVKNAEEVIDNYKSILEDCDKSMQVKVARIDENITEAFCKNDIEDLLRALLVFPNGVHAINWKTAKPVVSSSNNLATVTLENNEVHILTSLRFFTRYEATIVEEQIKVIAREYCYEIEKQGEYSSWTPVFDSPLLNTSKEIFKSLFHEELRVEAIHAGLECGIIKDRFGTLDAISIGPNIVSVHSPSEAVEISSCGEFFKFLREVLAKL